MIEALGMQLEPLRTVLKNETNEISVCADLKRRTGVFYTLIAVRGDQVRRALAEQMAAGGLFAGNSDFIGSFTQGEVLNLVFLYRGENLLSKREALYAVDFPRRKQLVENLVVALAETQFTGPAGQLLLEERNINVASDGTIYLNYFLDFQHWNPAGNPLSFYSETATLAFQILSREYEAKYEGVRQSYPSELQVLEKKAQLQSFNSFTSLLTFIKIIPDQPAEPAVGIRKVGDRIMGAFQWMRQNSMTLFLALIVAVTVVYTGYQVVMRLHYRSQTAKNTSYIGLDTIGEVYLGDEDA